MRPHMVSVRICTLPARCWIWADAGKLPDTGQTSVCESTLSLCVRVTDQVASVMVSPVLLQVITPVMIYFNPRLIFQNMELWRLFTNFLFFGSLGGALSLHTGLAEAGKLLPHMCRAWHHQWAHVPHRFHIKDHQLLPSMLPCTAAFTATVGLARPQMQHAAAAGP